MPKRNLTVGVTVNLKNYESLRLEVQDEVESEEDVRSLVAFLDGTLALFGQGNRETEDLVAHYRRRVMQGAVGGGAGEPAPVPAAATRPAASRPAAVPGVEAVVEPPAPEPVATEPPEEGPAPKPAPKAAAKPAPKTPAKAPAPSPTGAVCEACGAPVSAAEEKTSRLFVSKTLCKKCIQSL
jgi:hypothetical protein